MRDSKHNAFWDYLVFWRNAGTADKLSGDCEHAVLPRDVKCQFFWPQIFRTHYNTIEFHSWTSFPWSHRPVLEQKKMVRTIGFVTLTGFQSFVEKRRRDLRIYWPTVHRQQDQILIFIQWCFLSESRVLNIFPHIPQSNAMLWICLASMCLDTSFFSIEVLPQSMQTQGLRPSTLSSLYIFLDICSSNSETREVAWVIF